jgi:pimeloyl-ACP methyl ester carboxylesterase
MARNNIKYYIYDNPTKKEKTPIIFFHGIGTGTNNLIIGLILYVPFIYVLYRNFRFDRKILLMYMPEVASRVPSSNRIFTKDEMIVGVTQLFDQHGIKNATFIGHSFGTTCMAWFVNEAPWLVHSCYFIDPVCFLLNEPDVCFNFMYRTPTNPLQLIFYYFAGRELGISTVLARHFWW